MSEKDNKAKKRVDDEVELKSKISKLLRDFSKKYDVEAAAIDIAKNTFYPSHGNPETPMYNIEIYWKFDYLGH